MRGVYAHNALIAHPETVMVDYQSIVRNAVDRYHQAHGGPPLHIVPAAPPVPTWEEGPALPVAHLSAEDLNIMATIFIESGAVLVLEAEDGTRYRAHADGALLPPGLEALPRHETGKELS